MPDLSLTDDKQYTLEADRLARLHAVRSELDSEISEAAAARAVFRGSDKLLGAAVALLDGKEGEDNASDPEPELRELTRRRDVVVKAIELQEQRAAAARREAGAHLEKRLTPEYARLIGRVAAAAFELARRSKLGEFQVVVA